MDEAVTEANASRPASPTIPPLPDHRPTYRFTWDPALRRPGPGSVSEATENYHPRADAALGNTFPLNSDLSLSLGLSISHDWSSSKHGFNAISTVLNNPHKRAAPPKAHSFLPSVPAAELPRVRRKDFEPYLMSIKPEWERFEKSNRLGRDGAAQIDQPEPDPIDPASAALTPRTAHPPGKPLPPLAVVPPIFFAPTFDLGDPQTFSLVTETSEEHSSTLPDGTTTTTDPFAIAHSLPLLEKLTHYADLIEQHLVHEISLRSSSFFAALTNLQDLQRESGACLDRVTVLRRMLKEVDERTARRGLEMVRMEGRLANLERVQDGVGVVKGVGEMVGVASGLVNAGEWGEALGVIEELEGLWDPPGSSATVKSRDVKSPNGHALDPRTRAEPHIPLSALDAFAALPSHLQALTLQISTALTTEVVSVLTMDLHDRVEGKPSEGEVLLRDRVNPLLQGLVRTRGVRRALESWREAVLGEVRAAVKRHLPGTGGLDEEESTEAPEKTSGLGKDLREMGQDDFLKLLRRVFKSLMRCMEGVQTQTQVITELLDSIPLGSSSSADDISGLLSSVLSSTADLSHALPSKLLLHRTEAHARLPLATFHVLFHTTWTFVLSSEILCKRMIVSLRGAVVSQAKAFLSAFHAGKVEELARRVEEEVWAQADVADEMQRLLELVIDAAVKDPETFVLPVQDEEEAEKETVEDGMKPPLSPPSTPPHPPIAQEMAPAQARKQLHIEERGYFVVGATLQVLVVLLAEYVKLIVNLPLLTTDGMGRVIEFLKAFNSRTCQVVLGAGAMRSAGLKNITAKHLALASQSLSIAIAVIPYVRETFRRHLSVTQAVMLVEFDKLRRDYQEHQSEIHAKLVVIMGDRVGVHCKALQEVQWNGSEEKIGVHGYMELLVKETVTLHKVLTKYLAGPAVEVVMSQVLAAINHRLSEEYTQIDFESQTAKDRVLVDVRYLHEKVNGLKDVGGGLGMMLETVVHEKAVRGAGKRKLSEKLEAVVRGDQGPASKAVTNQEK